MNITPGRYRLSNGSEAMVLARMSDGRWVGERQSSGSVLIASWTADGRGTVSDLHVRLGDLPPPDVITGPGVYETRDGKEAFVLCRSIESPGWWVGESCGQPETWHPSGFYHPEFDECRHDMVRRLRDLPPESTDAKA